MTGAYVREKGGNPPLNIPDNLAISGDLFDRPANADEISASVNAAHGTIITDRNAEVGIHNEVTNKFELPLEKKWSGDFDLDDLPADAQVSFILKRFVQTVRKGSFTLKASESGQPANYQPVYYIINNDTGEVYSVRYSDMEGSGAERSTILSLPVGTYTVSHGEDPAGYDSTHAQSASQVSVSSSEETTGGAAANPDEIVLTSTYTRQSGSLQITKELAGYHGDNSFEKFTATYSVTDLSGRTVTDINGNAVGPVTLHYPNGFDTDNRAVITFENLPAGQYIVKEAIADTSYDNNHFTFVTTLEPESGIVTVVTGPAAQAVFTSTYTKVLPNPVPVTIKLVNYLWGTEEMLYNNTTSFRPGDQITITFTRQAVNPTIWYRINYGDWVNVPVRGNSGNALETINVTVPTEGVIVEFQDFWSQLKADDINVIKQQNVQFNAQAPQSLSGRSLALMRASTRGETTGDSEITVSNSARIPESNVANHRYQTDSWSLTVTMKNDGKLYSGDTEIGEITRNGNKWSVTLKGASFDDLTAKDADGNLYFYYIDSVSESNVPEGTTPSIDTDTISGDVVKRLYSEADMGTDKKLSVTNEILLANKEIKIVKVIDGTETPLSGAGFTLTRVDTNGNDATGADQYTSGNVMVDSTTGAITFSGLVPGRYKLEETTIPDGFIAVEGLYYITIAADGSTTLDTTVPHTKITPVTGTEYKVENEPGAALPNTGGPGTSMLYFLSSMLIGLAGTGLVMKRRMRNAA